LLVLAGVVVATGLMTGGFGLKMLGSSQYGGKHYFYFLAAVAGYFVFTSRRIPPHQAGWYVALFFLAGLASAVSILAVLAGSKFEYLLLLFPPAGEVSRAAYGGPLIGPERMMRLGELRPIAEAVYCLLLVRYGISGVLDLKRPWRLLLLFLAVGTGLMSGFRSFTLQLAILFAILFYLEGLHRTRIALALLGVMLLGGVVVLPLADKLPLVVQRSLSFLPGRFDYEARRNALESTEWRVDMWKQVLPEVPNTLFRGRGWSVNARAFFSTVEIVSREDRLASTMLTGNFHNGPLSVLIPFGLYGFIPFVWFLVAGLRVLHRNWKYGSPALRRVNTLLLAAFAAHAIFFLGIFGALEADMAGFAGLLGLAVALNGAVAAPAPTESAATGVELGTEYIKA
jgi:O-antigen ligase